MQLSSRIIKQVNKELEDIPLYPREIFSEREVEEHLVIAQTEAEIEDLLENARQKADRLLQESQKEIARMEAEAYRKGYAQGKESGWQEGQSQALEIYEKAKKVLQQAEDIRRQMFHNTEAELISLAVDIAEKLVCNQLNAHADAIMDIAQTVILQAVDCQQVVIYVAPEEAAKLEARKEEISTQLYSAKRVQIISDPNIKNGGCRIETEQGVIDATVEAMLSELKSVLKGGISNGNNSAGSIPAEA